MSSPYMGRRWGGFVNFFSGHRLPFSGAEWPLFLTPLKMKRPLF